MFIIHSIIHPSLIKRPIIHPSLIKRPIINLF